MKIPLILASGDYLFWALLKFLAIVALGYGVSITSIIVAALKKPDRKSKPGMILASVGAATGLFCSIAVFAEPGDFGFGFGAFCILPLLFGVLGLLLSSRLRATQNQSAGPNAHDPSFLTHDDHA